MRTRIALSVLTIVASVFVAAAGRAQEPVDDYPTDNDVNQIAKQLYCPVCPNTPLDVCETKACQDWRAQIKEQLTAGWTEEEVLDYFVAQYGQQVLAEPRRQGFTSLVWLLPVIAGALGLAVVYGVLKTWRAGRFGESSPAPPEADVAPQTLERIEEELREMR
jgi:cytochrome c-type biogenesis protein CcmH